MSAALSSPATISPPSSPLLQPCPRAQWPSVRVAPAPAHATHAPTQPCTCLVSASGLGDVTTPVATRSSVLSGGAHGAMCLGMRRRSVPARSCWWTLRPVSPTTCTIWTPTCADGSRLQGHPSIRWLRHARRHSLNYPSIPADGVSVHLDVALRPPVSAASVRTWTRFFLTLADPRHRTRDWLPSAATAPPHARLRRQRGTLTALGAAPESLVPMLVSAGWPQLRAQSVVNRVSDILLRGVAVRTHAQSRALSALRAAHAAAPRWTVILPAQVPVGDPPVSVQVSRHVMTSVHADPDRVQPLSVFHLCGS